MSPETRKTVRKQLNYQAKPIVLSLVKSKTNTIRMITL